MNKSAKILFLGLICFFAVFISCRYDVTAESITTTGTKSKNAYAQEYAYDMWSKPVTSYLDVTSDGTINRIEYISGKLIIEKYDKYFKLISSKKITPGLSLFGGVCSDEDAYYVITGQKNSAQSDAKEVFRIVKYSKDWSVIATCSINGANTTAPFGAGSLRCFITGNTLYIRTSHEMYKGSDGVSHQGSMLFSVNTNSMTVSDMFAGSSSDSLAYVPKSFNQFIVADGSKVYMADHAAGEPRGLVLTLYEGTPGSASFSGTSRSFNVLKIMGASSSNNTKLTLGGFAVTPSSFIMVGSSVKQDASYGKHKTRNVFALSIPRGNVSETSAGINWISTLKEGKYSASQVQFVKISDGAYMVLWQLKKDDGSGTFKSTNKVRYALIDSSGKKISSVRDINAKLSDCTPVLYNGRIVWYTTSGSSPVFYSIATNGKAEPAVKAGYKKEYRGLIYKITSTGSTLKASVCGISNKSASSISIPATVPIDSKNYKVTKIDEEAFKGNTAIKEVTMSSNITNIARGAFMDCKSLKTIKCSKNLTVVGKTAFKNCFALASFTMPDSLKEIRQGAFYNCTSLGKIVCNAALEKISGNAFRGCTKITTVTLGNALVSIGDSAFARCTSLETVTTGSNLENIGKGVFRVSGKLKAINIRSNKLVQVGDGSLKGISPEAVINVPEGKLKKYKSLFKNKGQSSTVLFVGV